MAIRISPRVQLSVVLLGIMFMAGGLSAFGGYLFGRESLRGVTQPVVNPILGDFSSNAQDLGQRQALLKESDIIAQVERVIQGQTTSTPTPTPTPAETPEETPAPESTPIAGFPKETSMQGVHMAVNSAEIADGNLVLEVSLTNDSVSSLQFIYTFLDVTSDSGTPLIAITQGLPTELPAESETFTGTVAIPLTSLDDVKSLNLSLSDFPNQDIQLKIQDIPAQP